MATSHDAETALRALVDPARYATVLALALAAVSLGCLAHAWTTADGIRLEPSLQMTRRLHLTDMALLPDEDLRHPGWGRPEQGRVGQPGLPDPRGMRRLVQPRPMRVLE